MLKTIKGDLIEYSDDKTGIFITHIVNSGNSMGSGIAKALFEKWSMVKSRYHQWFDGDKSHCTGHATLGNVQFVRVDDGYKNQFVVNMIGQDYPGGHDFNINGKEIHLPPIRLQSLEKCMLHVAESIFKAKTKTGIEYRIVAPWFGCGLAGSSKKDILPLIQRIWVDNGINVTIIEQ